MQVLPAAIIINASPSQREILRNPKYGSYAQGITLSEASKPRIPIHEIAKVIRRLRYLQKAIVADPDYEKRRPRDVIERIIVRIVFAAAAQLRAFPPL